MREFRVAEIFGPTIQGEGPLVGMPCHFVRFGGCDYRCSWCDTPHAVLPEYVNKLEKFTSAQIVAKIEKLMPFGPHSSPGRPDVQWVVLTGGNPGLLNLGEFIYDLHRWKYKVMVETQGSTFRSWYYDVDSLCFSPKPPSSGMEWDFNFFQRMVAKMVIEWPEMREKAYLKVPIFTDEDLVFARVVHLTFPDFRMFLSVGNEDPALPTVSNPNPEPKDLADVVDRPTTDIILAKFKEILGKVLHDPVLSDCQIFPQQHVLLWGNERGH